MHNIGLDVGFGYTKATDGKKTILFPSIVSPAVEIMFRSGLEDLSSRLDHLRITLDGAAFFVGELALRQGRFAYATLDRVRTQSQEYRILFLTALALLAESSYEECSVVTGLPVDDFGDRRLIEETLSGQFHLTLGKRELTLDIRHLTVVPQPCGAFMDLLFKDTIGTMDERFASSRVGIIDIGFKTTDFVLIRNGEFIQKLSGSLKKGMSLIYQAAIPKFTARYPGDWNLHLVEAALREGCITSLGKRIEIDPILLLPDLAGLAREITAWVHGRWSSEPVDFLICSGGGSLLIDPHLRKFFPQMTFLDQPQQANVRGFYKGAWYYDG
jgi:plasmid segregation protein ParM